MESNLDDNEILQIDNKFNVIDINDLMECFYLHQFFMDDIKKQLHKIYINNFKKEFCEEIDLFYASCSNDKIQIMINILNNSKNKKCISLRDLDWFVRNYSKNGNFDDIRESYKDELRTSKKKYFDPFKQCDIFMYYFPNTEYSTETTLGQLNFFKWVFSNGILIHVEKNIEQIKKEMNASKKLKINIIQ
jgi:hypothetical protein